MHSAELVCTTDKTCSYVIRLEDGAGSTHVFRLARADVVRISELPVQIVQSDAGEQASTSAVNTKMSVSLTFGAGQMAGMGNVILDPTIQLGLKGRFLFPGHPNWDADASGNLIYGKTESTDPATLSRIISKPGLQELRGQAHAIYNFSGAGTSSTAGVGLYVDIAHDLVSHPRYTPSSVDDIYAAEEGEITRNMVDTGVDLRFRIEDQQLASELHNVLFISGNRVAPNLLTYKPMLGTMWSNSFLLSGTRDQHGWRLLTDVDFYFARKAGVRYFNAHDGLGGTKREIDLSYGLAYDFSHDTRFTVKSYGYNNLNRGNSSAVPVGFKDGMSLQLTHSFE